LKNSSKHQPKTSELHNRKLVERSRKKDTLRNSSKQQPKTSELHNRKLVDDFDMKSSTGSTPNKSTTYHIAECAICFEETPVLCLSRKCRWHDAACSKCLRRVYVINAQNVTKNYPLCCFHPQCGQPVIAAQLEKHKLFASEAEVKKHYKMVILAKIKNTEGMRTVHCPWCEIPKGIRDLCRDRKYNCKNCSHPYLVLLDYATIHALEKIVKDDFGRNNGWARCPGCSILISKGGGCDHMVCGNCGLNFSWKKTAEKSIPLARPPDDEIYLWW